MFKITMAMVVTLIVVAVPAFGGTVQLPATGQKVSYGTTDDGALQKGIVWPSARFTDNKNGTVTDNLTGLIWLKNANCLEGKWTDALKSVGSLASGQCGLTDGSTAGHWRLPNLNELRSLVNASQSNMSAWLNTEGFNRVQGGDYWSSTTYAPVTDKAWYVNMYDGHVLWSYKTYNYYVWPVRSGQ